jgi:hypothetical protein
VSNVAFLREQEIARLRSLHGVYEYALYSALAPRHAGIEDTDLRHKAVLDEMQLALGRAAVAVDGAVPVAA